MVVKFSKYTYFSKIYLNGEQLLHNTVLASVTQQSESAICIHTCPHPFPLESPYHPRYTPPQVFAKHRADVPVLCCCFPLANYFTFGSLYMLMLLSLRPSFHLPPVSSGPFSMSLSLFLPCHYVHQYNFFFFRFHIYALAYDIYFFSFRHTSL